MPPLWAAKCGDATVLRELFLVEGVNVRTWTVAE